MRWLRRVAADQGPAAPAPTLDVVLRHHRGQLNAVRLLLALSVLAFHAAPLGGYTWKLAIPGVVSSTGLGTFAVGAFFALSGMLVTMSARRNSVGAYLRARLLRIVPAYAVVIALSAFVLAPIVYALTNGTLSGFLSLSVNGPFSYVVHNATFSTSTLRYTILNVFQTTTPFGRATGAGAINGSIWSIPIEVRCYVVALLVVVCGRRVGVHWAALVALAVVGMAVVAAHAGHSSLQVVQNLNPEYIRYNRLPLVFVFLCGALAGSLAERIRITRALSVAAIAAFGAALAYGGIVFATVGFGLTCLVIPILAQRIPGTWVTPMRNDLSYGTYLWAFPVQQTLAFAGLAAIPAAFLGLSAAITLALAAASWFLVEQPMLRRK